MPNSRAATSWYQGKRTHLGFLLSKATSTAPAWRQKDHGNEFEGQGVGTEESFAQGLGADLFGQGHAVHGKNRRGQGHDAHRDDEHQSGADVFPDAGRRGLVAVGRGVGEHDGEEDEHAHRAHVDEDLHEGHQGGVHEQVHAGHAEKGRDQADHGPDEARGADRQGPSGQDDHRVNAERQPCEKFHVHAVTPTLWGGFHRYGANGGGGNAPRRESKAGDACDDTGRMGPRRVAGNRRESCRFPRDSGFFGVCAVQWGTQTGLPAGRGLTQKKRPRIIQHFFGLVPFF